MWHRVPLIGIGCQGFNGSIPSAFLDDRYEKELLTIVNIAKNLWRSTFFHFLAAQIFSCFISKKILTIVNDPVNSKSLSPCHHSQQSYEKLSTVKGAVPPVPCARYRSITCRDHHVWSLDCYRKPVLMLRIGFFIFRAPKTQYHNRNHLSLSSCFINSSP